MNTKEIQAIEEIQGIGGFRVLQASVEAKLNSVKDVMNVKRDGLVAEQTLGRQLAYEVLKEFLSELKLTSSPPKEGNKTYE